MSRPPQNENGIGAAGEPQGAPNVYHPQPEPPPSYDEYTDPAIAHGWQNAYDETAELPSVTGGPGAPAVPGPVRGAGPRSRRKPKQSPWRSRRVAVAAGAVGAVSVAALVAGFSMSGSSGGSEGKERRTGSSAPDVTTGPATGASGAADGSGAPGSGSASESASASASSDPDSTKSASKSGEPSGGTSSAPATTSVPTSTATQADPGDSGSDAKPGKGQGNTKRPR